MERQQQNALRLAEFLQQHHMVKRVHYPGLEGHPGKTIHDVQAAGPGGVLSFETGSKELSCRVVNAVQLFSVTVSFGGVGSSISLPATMSHASIPEQTRRERALPEDLVRVSAGIEHIDDLRADLDQALRASSLNDSTICGDSSSAAA